MQVPLSCKCSIPLRSSATLETNLLSVSVQNRNWFDCLGHLSYSLPFQMGACAYPCFAIVSGVIH